MNPEAEYHLGTIKDLFLKMVDEKYRKGQAEHGGDLRTRNVARDIMEEAIDLFAYSATQVEQYKKINAAAAGIKRLVRMLQEKYEIPLKEIEAIELACDIINQYTM